MKLLALLLLMFSFSPARATSLELELIQGSHSKSQELSADGDFNPDRDKTAENIYSWDLSYTHSTVQSTDTTGSDITDNSHDLSAGWGFETPGHFSLNLNADYSTTPEENLQSVGPSLTLGYNYIFDESSKEEFHPALGADLTLGSLNYKETFSGKRRRRANAIARPTSGSEEITQKSIEGSLKVKPSSWVRARLSYTKYNYSKDVNQFLQYLDNHQALSQVSGGMNNALAGFYDNTLTASLNFYLPQDWEIDLKHAVSKVISDQSTLTSNKITLEKDLNDDWHLGFGAEAISSTADGTDTDHLVLVDLGYDF